VTATLVSHPFSSGIHEAFYFAAGCCLVAAIASWLRGAKYIYAAEAPEQLRPGTAPPAEATEAARAA
jgi:hypothetical protein